MRGISSRKAAEENIFCRRAWGKKKEKAPNHLKDQMGDAKEKKRESVLVPSDKNKGLNKLKHMSPPQDTDPPQPKKPVAELSQRDSLLLAPLRATTPVPVRRGWLWWQRSTIHAPRLFRSCAFGICCGGDFFKERRLCGRNSALRNTQRPCLSRSCLPQGGQGVSENGQRKKL